MKTYYELLDVAATASADEIKHAFRREIARYHPDKVQHLGQEFQEIASTRAAELTEAYRVLMDEAARRRYDEALESGGPAPRRASPAASGAGPGPETPPETRRPEPAGPPGTDRRFHQARATTNEFVRKAALSMLREAIGAVAGACEAIEARGFDAGFHLKGKRTVFGKGDPAVRLLARFVPEANASAVEESWPLAVSAGTPEETTCVLLLGGGLAPSKELSGAVGAQRRKTRKSCPVFVPVDVRDWEALFPPDAPASVRAIIQRLRDRKG